MSAILKEERKASGGFYASGSPIMRTYYTIKCAHCQKEVEVLKGNYREGRRCFACRNVTHGGKGTALYKVWDGMLGRCTRPSQSAYPRYGGKGVKVLFKDYAHFKEWSEANGYVPNQRLSIDRIDSSGNYEPDNCRWISLSENSAINNRKPVNQIDINTGGVVASFISAKDAATALGVKDQSSILKVCRGVRNKAYGYNWEFT